MGLTFHEYKFLDYIKKSKEFGDVLTLGRLEILLKKNDLSELQVINEKDFDEKYSEKILINKFGALSVTSIDNSNYENATEIIDLNLPIKKINKQYDTIIDFGTSEHIFNVAQCLQNIANLCKNGGFIIHCLPANNNCGHGFWQFSPELFFSLYNEKNGFSDTEVHIIDLTDMKVWWKVNLQNQGERIELNSDVPLYIASKTTKIRENTTQIVQQSDYKFLWENKYSKSQKISKKNLISRIAKDTKTSFKSLLAKLPFIKDYYLKFEQKKLSNKKFFKKNRYLEKKNK